MPAVTFLFPLLFEYYSNLEIMQTSLGIAEVTGKYNAIFTRSLKMDFRFKTYGTSKSKFIIVYYKSSIQTMVVEST